MRNSLLAFVTAGLAALPAGAQGRGRGSQGIPPGHLPPPGECKVWYEGRPPGQQGAPMSCEAARREAARTGGRVVYGGDERRDADDRRGDRDCSDKDRRKGKCGDGDRDERRGRDCSDKDRKKGKCGDHARQDRRDRDDSDSDSDRRDRGRDRDRNACLDRDRDGRCDRAAGDRPSGALPEMVWGVIFGRGQNVADVRRWVGTGSIAPRFTDADRNGVPEIVSWYAGERIVQRWTDTNRDGRADAVAYYQNGKVVRVVR